MREFVIPFPHARRALLLVLDLAVLVASAYAAVALRLGLAHRDALLFPKATISAGVVLLCLYYSDLYDNHSMRLRRDFVLKLGQSLLIAALLLSALYYTIPSIQFGRGILLVYLPFSFVSLLVWRGLHAWLSGRRELTDNVLILGTGVSAQQVAVEVLGRSPLGYRIVGFLGEHQAEVGRSLVNPSVIGTTDDLMDTVRREDVKHIVVALEDRRGKMPVKELLVCKVAGIGVEEVSSFYERITGKILVNNLRPSWLLFSQGFNKPRLLRNSKRAVEFASAVILLVATAPVLALLALLVRLDSRGPAFYRQERVGEGGRTFRLIKLRTMGRDAEAGTGPVWASSSGDARITRVGRWLRKARLDELPQLINVVRGEMSFVGPRPERPHFVEHFRKIIPYYDERHSVKPGITGWAQVKFRYGATIEDAFEKHQYDLYYVKRMSLWFDMLILLKTLQVVTLGKGAR